MQLTIFTNISLRVLMHLTQTQDQWSTVGELSKALKVSRNHVSKVIHSLARSGFIYAKAGKGGGITLGRDAKKINIGDLVRHTEDITDIVKCKRFMSTCPFKKKCGLKVLLNQAQDSFMATLSRYTLEDISGKKEFSLKKR